jgi:lipopolysaccharide transport system permease protein
VLKQLSLLYQHRELLVMWTRREIKVRYKQSFLGAAWALLQPLALMGAFTLVFSVLVKLPSDDIPYPVFSYTSLVVWTFFATSISFAIPTLVNNLNLVTKVYFPREILPLASIGAAFIDFGVASLLLVGLLMWFHISISGAIIWLPLLVLIQILLIVGVVLPAAALNVFYRDIRFVVPVAVQLWLYATPIIYPMSLVPEALRTLYLFNPMAGLVDSYRRVLLRGEPPQAEPLAISATISVVLAVVGYMYFKRSEAVFADLI